MAEVATINLPSATSVDEVLCNKTSEGINDVVRVPIASLAEQVNPLPDTSVALAGNILSVGSDGETYELVTPHKAIGSVPADNLFLGIFCNENDFQNFQFLTSNDGRNFEKKTSFQIWSDGVGIGGTSPSFAYVGHTAYISCSLYTSDDARYFKTTDFFNYDRVDITFGSSAVKGTTAPGAAVSCDTIFAPEFFHDNDGALYMSASLQTQANQTDADGRSIKYFWPYISECTDIDNDTWSAPVRVNYSDTGAEVIGALAEDPSDYNRIDPDFLRLDDGTYVQVVKREYDKTIELWTAPSYDGEYTYVTNLPFERCEAPKICYGTTTDEIIVYADQWEQEAILYCTADQDDLTTWSDPKPVGKEGRLRHGSVYNVGRLVDNPAELVGKFAVWAAWAGVDNKRDGYYTALEDGSSSEDFGTELQDGAQTLTPMDRYCYTISGTDVATLTLDGWGDDDGIGDAHEFFIRIDSASTSCGVIIETGDYYTAQNGTEADYFGFGEDQNAVLHFVREDFKQPFRVVGSRSRHLGYFGWDGPNKPAADDYTNYEITITDLGPKRVRMYSDGTRWKPFHDVVLARGNTDITVVDDTTSYQNFFSYTLDGGLIGPNDQIMFCAELQLSASDADGKTFAFRHDATPAYRASMVSQRSAVLSNQIAFSNRNSVSSQIHGEGYTGVFSGTLDAGSVDTSSDSTLALSFIYDVLGSGTKSAVLKSHSIIWRAQ
ncbi:hypothetical protein [Roseibium sp.]|uniref:hypothetical protein n=1 Tax=Roseibium sp. TaxID=1936156 RepID=UPI003265C45C